MGGPGRSVSFRRDAFYRDSKCGEIQVAQMPRDAAPHAVQMRGIGHVTLSLPRPQGERTRARAMLQQGDGACAVEIVAADVVADLHLAISVGQEPIELEANGPSGSTAARRRSEVFCPVHTADDRRRAALTAARVSGVLRPPCHRGQFDSAYSRGSSSTHRTHLRRNAFGSDRHILRVCPQWRRYGPSHR